MHKIDVKTNCPLKFVFECDDLFQIINTCIWNIKLKIIEIEYEIESNCLEGMTWWEKKNQQKQFESVTQNSKNKIK